MFTFNILRFIKALRSKGQSDATPSAHPESQRKSDLDIIREHEGWLRQEPRTSFDIARRLFTKGRCSMSDMEITMYDMFPALYEAGYEALDGAGSDLWDCVWVKSQPSSL